jgi:hypothetical protein
MLKMKRDKRVLGNVYFYISVKLILILKDLEK